MQGPFMYGNVHNEVRNFETFQRKSVIQRLLNINIFDRLSFWWQKFISQPFTYLLSIVGDMPIICVTNFIHKKIFNI